MSQVLRQLPKFTSEKLIVGLELSDDAAVYKINEEQAIIETLDFFPPVVDDPYTFGQIAAANALSDIYAMGGKPILALNIIGFPNCLDPSVLADILKGGADKVKEAGALLVGGHSVEDDEPKYGLSVTGIVHPDKVMTNSNAKPGDVLILTKPIGSGILNTAIKADILEEKDLNYLMDVMSCLNKVAGDAVCEVGANSVTDITGFGVIGHSYEMANNSEVSIIINHKSVPVMNGVKENAEMGIIPAGAYKNMEFYKKNVYISKDVEGVFVDILYDPQTSGGLLISLPEEKGDKMIEILTKKLEFPVAIIGKVVKKREFDIYVE